MTDVTTSSGGTAPADTGAWLLPDEAGVTERLSMAVASSREDPRPGARRIGLLAKAAQLTLAAEVAARLRAALHQDLSDLLIGGIARHRALRDAARMTLQTPGAESDVTLGRHRVQTHQEPSVDLYVDQVRVITLACEIDVEFQVAELTGTVRSGRLVTLEMAPPHVRGSLTVHGLAIYQNRGELMLAPRLDLGAGVRVLSKDEMAGYVQGGTIRPA